MPDKLLEGFTAQQKSYTQAYADLLRELAIQGQAPEVLLVACCDSRIMPKRIFGVSPGQFFMLRNIANVIPPYWQIEIGIASILEYAVIELEIPISPSLVILIVEEFEPWTKKLIWALILL